MGSLAVFALALAIGAGPPARLPLRVLVFSKTVGFRHDSIPVAKAVLAALAAQRAWKVEFSEDAGVFTQTTFYRFDVIVFLNTTGDILNPLQEAAMQAFCRSGRGFVGIHSAADTEYGWAWYGELLGTYFASHPAVQEATINVEDRSHPTTLHLPPRWSRTDEWYNFRDNPRGRVHVLATLDESTYQGGEMGSDHPITWCREFEGARSWYTAMGHTSETYQEPLYKELLARSILWAGRRL